MSPALIILDRQHVGRRRHDRGAESEGLVESVVVGAVDRSGTGGDADVVMSWWIDL